MSALVLWGALLFGGEALVASALIMLIAWLGASHASASRRHLTWAAAFGALLLLPVLAVVMPSPIHIAIAQAPDAAPMSQEALAPLPKIAAHNGVHVADLAFASEPAPAFSLDAALFAKLALFAWLLGVAAILLRGAVAAFGLYRLRRRSRVHRFGHLPISGPACELRIANAQAIAHGPVTWGLLRPVILLPHDAQGWPYERLDAVLRHELAHVARRDCLTQMLALATCALYWPNPLVWFGVRRLRAEAEMAADDAVIVSGIRPSSYASALLRIANDFRNEALPRLPLAMAAPSALESRVQAVLSPNQPRCGVTTMDIVRMASLGLIATAVLALARPSLAQDAPKAVTPATPATAPMPQDGNMQVIESDDGDVDAKVAPIGGKHQHQVRRYVITVDDNGNRHTRVYSYANLTPEQKRQIHDAVTKARAAVAATKPQIELAMRQARVAEQALAAERPRIEAEVRVAKQVSEVEVQRALEEARAALTEERMKATDAQVQHALDRALAALDEKRAHMRDDADDESSNDDGDTDDNSADDSGDDHSDDGASNNN